MATSTHCVFIISNRAATGRGNLHFFHSDCNILFFFSHLYQSGGLFIKGLDLDLDSGAREKRLASCTT